MVLIFSGCRVALYCLVFIFFLPENNHITALVIYLGRMALSSASKSRYLFSVVGWVDPVDEGGIISFSALAFCNCNRASPALLAKNNDMLVAESLVQRGALLRWS